MLIDYPVIQSFGAFDSCPFYFNYQNVTVGRWQNNEKSRDSTR